MIYLGTVIKNRRGKESLALSKKWTKMHFEEKILEKQHVYILVTKIYQVLKYLKNMKWSPKSWHRPFHLLSIRSRKKLTKQVNQKWNNNNNQIKNEHNTTKQKRITKQTKNQQNKPECYLYKFCEQNVMWKRNKLKEIWSGVVQKKYSLYSLVTVWKETGRNSFKLWTRDVRMQLHGNIRLAEVISARELFITI